MPGSCGASSAGHRERHPPRPRRGAGQGGRLGHRHEPLTDRPGLDHEHRLAAELRAPAPPPPGHSNGDAAPPFGHELHRLDPQGGRQIAHRPGRYGRDRTKPADTTRDALTASTGLRACGAWRAPRSADGRLSLRQVERASVRGSPPLGDEERPAGKRYAGDPGRERDLRRSRRARGGGYTTSCPARPCIQEPCNPLSRSYPRARGSILLTRPPRRGATSTPSATAATTAR